MILEKMNKVLSRSKLDQSDIERHATTIKKAVLKKHRAS